MKNLLWAVLVGVVSFGMVGCATTKTELEEVKRFHKLEHALTFLDKCLVEKDYKKIRTLCLRAGTNPHIAKSRESFDMLVRAAGTKPLSKRFAAESFPRFSKTYTLGGHRSEIGCVHVDFVKKAGAWYLADIWSCW